MNTSIVTKRPAEHYSLDPRQFVGIRQFSEFAETQEYAAFQVIGDSYCVASSNVKFALVCFPEHLFHIDLESIPSEMVWEVLKNKTLILIDGKFSLGVMLRDNHVSSNTYDLALASMILRGVDKKIDHSIKGLVACYLEPDDSILPVSIIDPILGIDRVFKVMKLRFKLYDLIQQEVEGQGLQSAVSLENKVQVVLAYMELSGFRLDSQAWERLNHRLAFEEGYYWYKLIKETRQDLPDDLTDRFGDPLYPVPKAAARILKAHGVNVYNSKTHKESIAKELISQSKVPIAKTYLDWANACQKVHSYGLEWLQYINPTTGRIHTRFNQIVSTGRISCGDTSSGPHPNLQSVPKNAKFRQCFETSQGRSLIVGDYDQQEAAILADQSEEPGLLNFFLAGKGDFHCYVARLLYIDILSNCSDEEIKSKYSNFRENAKQVTFTLTYGGSYETIASRNKITVQEAIHIMDQYDKAFPGVAAHFDQQYKKFVRDGYITVNPVTNRRRLFSTKQGVKTDHHLRRICMNTPIQGTAADIGKTCLLMLFNEILKRGWLKDVLIVLQLHDEFILDAPNHLAEEARDMLKNCMYKAASLYLKTLSLKAEPTITKQWLR